MIPQAFANDILFNSDYQRTFVHSEIDKFKSEYIIVTKRAIIRLNYGKISLVCDRPGEGSPENDCCR